MPPLVGRYPSSSRHRSAAPDVPRTWSRHRPAQYSILDFRARLRMRPRVFVLKSRGLRRGLGNVITETPESAGAVLHTNGQISLGARQSAQVQFRAVAPSQMRRSFRIHSLALASRAVARRWRDHRQEQPSARSQSACQVDRRPLDKRHTGTGSSAPARISLSRQSVGVHGRNRPERWSDRREAPSQDYDPGTTSQSSCKG